MLKRTFIHLPTVGEKRELALWRAGVSDWDAFLADGGSRLPRALYNLGRPLVEDSLAALEDGREGLKRLAGMIPQREHWRFWPACPKTVYLDIETGEDPEDFGGITVVGLYDGERVSQYVAGENLWEAEQAMAGYDMVVTFAGSSFDLPVLRRHFSRLIVPPVHVDLRWVLARLGHKGGLKRIERVLGIGRPDEVGDMDGFAAVRLWAGHLVGSQGALDLLLSYNACDIVNLKPLLGYACREMEKQLLGRLARNGEEGA